MDRGVDTPMGFKNRSDNNRIIAKCPNKKSKKPGIVRSTHKVKKGDSLYGISAKYDIAVEDLKAANKIRGNEIKIGSTLKIPGSKEKIFKRKKSPSPRKNNIESHQKNVGAPAFRWPVTKVKKYKRDGEDGVKPIGIVIDASSGSNVVCSATGVVEKIGYMRGFGNYVIVKHPSGFSTVYSNIAGIAVSEGDEIRTGQMIGRVSNDSRIHFQIDLKGRPENPLDYLPKKG